MLLTLALDQYLVVRGTYVNANSLSQYERGLAPFMRYCDEQGVHDTDSLNAALVAGYVSTIRSKTGHHGRPLSSRTVLDYAKQVRTLLSWLVKEELAPARCLRWELPKAEKKIPTTLDGKEVTKLLASCSESWGPALQARDAALLLLLVDTGMRASELCSLRVHDVRLDGDPHVLVRYGKGSKWREIGPLSSRTVRALRAYVNTWRLRQGPQDDRLFLTRFGSGMEVVTLERLLERVKRRTGLDVRCTPHSFRHSWAKSKAQAGTDTLVISRLLGHADLATTSLYLGQFGSADARRQTSSVVDTL